MTDTSKEYVAMCDWAVIQERWKPKAGDCYYDNRFKRISMVTDKCLEPEEIGVFTEFRDEFIYLPDLRALQEWVRDYFDHENNWIVNIGSMLAGDYYGHTLNGKGCDPFKQFKTFEQKLLAFFMDTVHGQRWEGDKWISK